MRFGDEDEDEDEGGDDGWRDEDRMMMKLRYNY